MNRRFGRLADDWHSPSSLPPHAGRRQLAARQSAPPAIPKVLAGITATANGSLVFQAAGQPAAPEVYRAPPWTLEQARGNPRGTENGIAFDFGKPDFAGTLIFGLVPFHDTKFPQPVYRTSAPISAGKAEINIKTSITDRYDMVGWQKSGTGVLGYRVVSQTGGMIYDGRVRFRYPGAGPFDIDVTMVEGPFVGNVQPRQAVISFQLDRPAPCAVLVGARSFACKDGETRQEILIDTLQPATDYAYKVRYGTNEEAYGFRTAPRPGTRKPFLFTYGSDSRGGQGGGERNFSGPNAYIIRRLMAVSTSRNAAFMQFTGDLVSGYSNSPDALTFELANWKRAIEPQAHWMPVYTGMGNHDSVLRDFAGPGARSVRLDRFPYDTMSAEAVFARELVNPENGPASEDGAAYDPDPSAVDFPSYRRNVYWFQYDNAAMVVLNSDYWYAPSIALVPGFGRQPPRLPDGPADGLAREDARRDRAQQDDRPRLPHRAHAAVPERRARGRRDVVRRQQHAAGHGGREAAREGHHRAPRRPAHAHPEAPEGSGGADGRRAQLQQDAPRRHGADLPARLGQTESGAHAAVLPDQQRGGRRAVLRAGRHALVGGGERVLHPARDLPLHRRGPACAARNGEPRDARGAGPRRFAIACLGPQFGIVGRGRPTINRLRIVVSQIEFSSRGGRPKPADPS